MLSEEITQRKTDAMGYYLSVGSNKTAADYECDRKEATHRQSGQARLTRGGEGGGEGQCRARRERYKLLCIKWVIYKDVL